MNERGTEEFILNVDDTEAACYVKTRILSHAGYRVLEAHNGRQALELAREYLPALVVLDVKMPDIDGYEVCRILKEDPLTQGILILQTSASFTGAQYKIRALDNGADNYLAEPFEPEELIANVQAMLRLARVEREMRTMARRKDEFLAVLAHELRNPLAPIKSALELLRRLQPEASQQESEARAIIERQTDHLVRLVDDLLDVARISRGQIRLREENVNVNDAVEAAIETSSIVIKERSHQLTLSMPAQPLWVRGDPVRISQAVANLLNNAAKFTPPGGKLKLRVDEDDGVLIQVEDNGDGIAPSQQGRIFDLFAQAGASSNPAQEGLGIGLFLVKTLVEMHGGRISVTSGEDSVGSRFVIRLPAAAAPTRTGTRPLETPAARDLRLRRVLVVDDNVDAATMIGTLLKMEGHSVDQCHDGASAIERARQIEPDVVVLDLGLPDMSGLDVARALRSLPAMQNTLIIALTGYGQERDKEAVQAAGFNLHLTKPVMFEQLSRALAGQLD
jgi:signal transduction histidine kinase